jgi:hypothetical protein
MGISFSFVNRFRESLSLYFCYMFMTMWVIALAGGAPTGPYSIISWPSVTVGTLIVQSSLK